MPAFYRKLLLFFWLSAFSATSLHAQLGEVIRKSESNRGKHEVGVGTGSSSPAIGGEDMASACVNIATSPCAQQCFEMAITLMANMWEHHLDMLQARHENRELVKLEIMPHLAFDYKGVVTLMPRIRGMWGFFGTDVRLSRLSDSWSDTPHTYTTLDWSMLQLNLIATKHFFLRLGSGIMTEQTDLQGIFFNEHFLGADIHWTRQITTNLEGRVAFDYTTMVIPRWEVNARANVQLMRYRNSQVFATIGVIYQNYYNGAGEFLSPQGGVMVSLK